MTLVTIITPSLNQGAYLEQTIRSVLEQDHGQIQYLVVDGGSADGSVEIIRRYASKIDWWVSEPDLGQADAINKALARARGEVVAWINSDDYYLPGAIAEAVRGLESRPGVALLYGDMLAVDEHGDVTNLFRYPQISLEDLLSFHIIGQPSVFLRRSAVEKAGRLDPTFHLLLDHQLWIRVALQGELFHCPKILAAARFHPAAKNRARAHEFGGEAFRIVDWAAQHNDLASALAGVNARARAAAYRVQARYLLDAGEPRGALQAWFRALAMHPATALARLNILASAFLDILGLGGVRRAWLQRRRAALSGYGTQR
jgi:glycosyltransferase involved in cell wall biosynthesis